MKASSNDLAHFDGTVALISKRLIVNLLLNLLRQDLLFLTSHSHGNTHTHARDTTCAIHHAEYVCLHQPTESRQHCVWSVILEASHLGI